MFDVAVNLVVLSAGTSFGTERLELFGILLWFRNLGVSSATLKLVLSPPVVAFARRSVHASFDKSEIGRPITAWTIAFPDVGSIVVDLVMERVVNCNIIATMGIDG